MVEFEVAASVGTAFRLWTEGCSNWWPPSHSMSAGEAFQVVFEPRAGGRIYEVGDDGDEYPWGRVTVWEPPTRLEYSWHIFLDETMATTVSVTFSESPRGSRVRLVNDGFEVFGDEAGRERAGRVGSAWEMIVGNYRNAI